MNKWIADFINELCEERERLEKQTQRQHENFIAEQAGRFTAERKIKELLKVIRKLKKEAQP